MRSYFQVARKYIPTAPQSGQEEPVSEYSRLITYGVPYGYPEQFTPLESLNGNARLVIDRDSHLATYARFDGKDVHFVAANGNELPFELVYYSNGTGEWWINTQSPSFYIRYGSSRDYSPSVSIWDDSSHNGGTFQTSLVQHTDYLDSHRTGALNPGDIHVVAPNVAGTIRRESNSVLFTSFENPVAYTTINGNELTGCKNPCSLEGKRTYLYELPALKSNGNITYADSASAATPGSLCFGVIPNDSFSAGGHQLLVSFRGISCYASASAVTFYWGTSELEKAQSITTINWGSYPALFQITCSGGSYNNGEYTQQVTIRYQLEGYHDIWYYVISDTVLSHGMLNPLDDSTIWPTPYETGDSPSPHIQLLELRVGGSWFTNVSGLARIYDEWDSEQLYYVGLYEMLFHNESIRTIEAAPSSPVIVTPTVPIHNILINRVHTYQGLAGGYN